MRDSNILVTLGLLLALDVLANELFDVRECAFVSTIGTESLPLQSCTDNRRRRARPDGWRPCLADGQNAAVHVDHANGDSLLLRARRSVVVAQVKALIHCKCLHDRLLGLAQPLLLEPTATTPHGASYPTVGPCGAGRVCASYTLYREGGFAGIRFAVFDAGALPGVEG